MTSGWFALIGHMSTNTTPRPGSTTYRGTYATHTIEVRYERGYVEGHRNHANSYRIYMDGRWTGTDYYDGAPTAADIADDVKWMTAT